MTRAGQRLAQIVHKFRGQTIGVLGDFMLDELWRGEATRISPEAPVPVVLMIEEQTGEGFPGGAGNVAANVTALGGRAVPFGVIGADESGLRLQELLETRRIPCRALVREKGRVTTRKVRIVAHQQQLLRLDYEKSSDLSSPSADSIVQSFARWVGRLRALVISDYRKGSITTDLFNRVSSLARQNRLPIFVDPKPEHPEICRHATLVTPNLHEAQIMTGRSLHERRELLAAGRRLLAELDCSYLLITRGPEGMTLFEAGGAVHEIHTVPRPVYDVTGAGDTVIATLALAHASGATMREAAELANLAGGLVVLKFGTAQITAPELLEAIASSYQGS